MFVSSCKKLFNLWVGVWVFGWGWECLCARVGLIRTTYIIFIIYTHTVYDYTVYDCIFGEFPAKNAVCTPHIYGSG
jgi:hypothetical protein